MKIIWSPLSIERLTEISLYVAEDNPTASIKLVDSIYNLVDRLEEFPNSGRIVPEFNNQDIREIVYNNYRIIYRIGQKEVIVLTIRNYKQILKADDVN